MRNQEIMKILSKFKKIADKEFCNKNGMIWKMDEYLKNAKKVIEIIGENGDEQSINAMLPLTPNNRPEPLQIVGHNMINALHTANEISGDEFTPIRDNILQRIVNDSVTLYELVDEASNMAQEYVAAHAIPARELKAWNDKYKKLKWNAKNLQEKYETACKIIEK